MSKRGKKPAPVISPLRMGDRIVGADIGQSFGWSEFVIVDNGAGEPHGSMRGYGTITCVRDVTKALEAIRKLLGLQQPTLLAVESVEFASYRDAHASYWRIRTLVELAAAELEIPIVEVPVNTLKLWATGSGKADKVAMCAAANARWGLSLVAQVKRPKGSPRLKRGEKVGSKADEDMADALLVGAWACQAGSGHAAREAVPGGPGPESVPVRKRLRRVPRGGAVGGARARRG